MNHFIRMFVSPSGEVITVPRVAGSGHFSYIRDNTDVFNLSDELRNSLDDSNDYIGEDVEEAIWKYLVARGWSRIIGYGSGGSWAIWTGRRKKAKRNIEAWADHVLRKYPEERKSQVRITYFFEPVNDEVTTIEKITSGYLDVGSESLAVGLLRAAEAYAPQTMHVLRTLRDEPYVEFKGGYADPRDLFYRAVVNGDYDVSDLDLNQWLGIHSLEGVYDISAEEFMKNSDNIPEDIMNDMEEMAGFEDEEIASGDTRRSFELQGKKALPNSTWLVHFSDNVSDILEDGFTVGTDEENYNQLGLTTYHVRKGVGYNFAFKADDRRGIKGALHHRGSNSPKYGKDCVVFQSSGIDTYHYGDQEHQVIFWGPWVKPKLIYALINAEGGWEVADTEHGVSQRLVRFEYQDIDEAIEWVIKNHGQIDAVREKSLRRKAHRRIDAGTNKRHTVVKTPGTGYVESWYDEDGKLHREDGPAQVEYDSNRKIKTTRWMRHGEYWFHTPEESAVWKAKYPNWQRLA